MWTQYWIGNIVLNAEAPLPGCHSCFRSSGRRQPERVHGIHQTAGRKPRGAQKAADSWTEVTTVLISLRLLVTEEMERFLHNHPLQGRGLVLGTAGLEGEQWQGPEGPHCWNCVITSLSAWWDLGKNTDLPHKMNNFSTLSCFKSSLLREFLLTIPTRHQYPYILTKITASINICLPKLLLKQSISFMFSKSLIIHQHVTHRHPILRPLSFKVKLNRWLYQLKFWLLRAFTFLPII